MSLDDVWQAYIRQGLDGARAAVDDGTALETFYAALLAWADADAVGAAALARAAARLQPDSRVFAAAVRYLDHVLSAGQASVYVDGAAFAVFVREGGNVGLYAALSDALRERYAACGAGFSLLDIGVGDGMALLPALVDRVTALDLVEPSAAMLARTSAALDARGVTHRAVNATVQDFITQEPPSARWDIIQATFSLQSLPPDERPAVLTWLRAHGARVLLAEFDVPDFAAMLAPDRVRYVVARYERGVAEYEHSPDGRLVEQGFLMPVFFGYFDRSAARTNWEGPIQGWADALRAAGFTAISVQSLFDYFWAGAYLIDAR